ncbi:MAG: 2-oxoacid:acceptor oxidoreductase subunit alpha [Deltaproteobacteria bacterium]|nr:2-oxoacid:acceptor oxidoreductase subunit alpha [Deltaproteobacteria bacterium]
MAKSKPIVDTGIHFIDGNMACAEGAIAAGCRFVSGYPITPSTEVVEHMAKRFPEIGGMFIQMEDELAASICFQGAVWSGVKGMTVTSGPGFSLMMEHVGLAAALETPSVFVDVQRAGPSTGLPTAPAQQDMMQARWGSHGDYEIIALSPSSPQECFDYIVTCFNLSEKYRCPVFFMMDETVGHMHGKVKIPDASQIDVLERQNTTRPPGEYQPYKIYEGSVPEMVKVGMGHRIHITGLTHDEQGYPAMNADAQQTLVKRLCSKITDNVDDISIIKTENIDDSDVVVISYGITSRIAEYAVNTTREQGINAGTAQLVTIWPFNDRAMMEIASKTKNIIVAEMNLGQIVNEVRRAVGNAVPVHFLGNAGGRTISPELMIGKIREVTR